MATQTCPQAVQQTLTPEQVCRQFAPRVYQLAFRMLGNSADAADVTQDVLLRVVRKLDSFQGHSAFTTWLHRVTINAAAMHRRKNARHVERRVQMPETDWAGGGQLWANRPEQEAMERETRWLIDKAVAGLPEKERRTFVLADVRGLANAEVSAALGLSVPAVKSRLHRARLHLRQALAPHFEQLAG